MPIDIDGRIKFSVPAIFPAGSYSASLSVEVFGGPLARVQVAVFDATNKVVQGVGFDGFGSPLTTEDGGKVGWLFRPTADCYIKWGVQAVRSAGNLGNYSVTAKLRLADGTPLVSGQFSALIPDGKFADDIIYDGADLVLSVPQANLPVPAGALI